MIHGLKLKGFEFKNRIELENFIKDNCSCADDLKKQIRTYYIKSVPFLLHCYKTEIKPIISDSIEVTITADLGFYRFL